MDGCNVSKRLCTVPIWCVQFAEGRIFVHELPCWVDDGIDRGNSAVDVFGADVVVHRWVVSECFRCCLPSVSSRFI